MTVISFNKEKDIIQIKKNESQPAKNVGFQISCFDYEFLKNMFNELDFEEIILDEKGKITHIKIKTNEHLVVYPYDSLHEKIPFFSYQFFKKLFEDKISNLNYHNLFS